MEQNSKEGKMKNFKKAVSVVVLFSFVFSACERNANLVRGNLVGADVGTPSAITGEDNSQRRNLVDVAVKTPSTITEENNSQKGYKDELGSFTKPKSADGQLQMFGTSQGIPATYTTKPKSADGQLQMFDTSQGIPATDTTKPITFNNPGGVALNPHTFSFHGREFLQSGSAQGAFGIYFRTDIFPIITYTTATRYNKRQIGNREVWDSTTSTYTYYPPEPRVWWQY
jgi:predicted small secreted protein